MSDFSWAAKLLADFGVLGVFVVAIVMAYRLTDKWAGLMVAAQNAQAAATAKQAEAMGAMAAAVKDGQGDQREVLIAVRVLADRMDAQRRYLERIETNCERGGCRAA